MSLATLEKRLDAAEIQLTPREWAIRLADEMRKHPSAAEFLKAEARGAQEESSVMRPFQALAEQAEQQHPGKRPADWEAGRALHLKLSDEYDMLKRLLAEVNEQTWTEGRALALMALVRLVTVPELPFSVRHATLAVERMKAWRGIAVSVLGDIFTHQAAVRIVQDRHFNGHAILYRDMEEKLTLAVRVMTNAVEDYDMCREMTAAVVAKAKRKRKADDKGTDAVPALDIEAIRAGIAGKATALAEWWASTAKRDCTLAGMDDRARTAYAWQCLQEGYGVRT
jgi:hypothetical protein